jgi:hypothetical protein
MGTHTESVFDREVLGSARPTSTPGLVARLRRQPKWRLLWRSLLAGPFALSLLLTLIVGPATVDSQYVSFV